MIDLTDRVALITGGARGIGATVARTFAELGADVALVDLEMASEAVALVEEIRALGRRAELFTADVSILDEALRVVSETVEALGCLHILVCNAGINRDGVLWKMTEEQWDRVIDVDLKGTFNYLRAAAPHFKAQGFGRIITVTSINGLRGKFGQTNYCAAKAGVVGLTKSAAKDLGRYNVTANSIAPGFILTEMGEAMPSEFRDAAVEESVLKKPGTPTDIAALAAFLASESAGHITGEVIKVDGGQYI